MKNQCLMLSSDPELSVPAAWVGTHLQPNRAWRALRGEPSSAVWRPWRSTTNTRAFAHLDELVLAQGKPTSTAIYIHADGAMIVVQTGPVEGSTTALAVAHDVSLLADALMDGELDLLRERQRRTTMEFHLQRSLHDLGNHLHSIGMRTSFLRAAGSVRVEDQGLLDEIERTAARARERLASLDLVAKPAIDRDASTDLGEAVARAAALSRRDGGVLSIAAEVSALPRVSVRADDLLLLLVHLFDNVREAGAMARVVGSYDERQVVLRISDSGPGISAELLTKIWKPFFSTKGKGHYGHGLSLATQIAQRNGVTIEVISPGEAGGTCFTLTLPRVGSS